MHDSFFLVITYDMSLLMIVFCVFFCFCFFFFFFCFCFFFHECSLKCTALFLDIHVVFNFNFLKDNETFKSVIKGKQLHTLSSSQIHIILDEFDFGPNWTIRFIFPCP